MQYLTNSQLNYMICIRALCREGTVRATDISRQIKLSMPSVHNMLGTLEGLELIEKHRHSVALPPAGDAVLGYYDTAIHAAQKLLQSAGIEDCEEDALAVVTALSPAALDKIVESMR